MEVERQGREPREVQEGARGGERKGRMGRAKGAMRKATQRGKEALSEARDVAMGAAQSMRDQGREKYHQARGDRGPPAIAAGDVPLTEEDKLRKKSEWVMGACLRFACVDGDAGVGRVADALSHGWSAATAAWPGVLAQPSPGSWLGACWRAGMCRGAVGLCA